VLSLLEFFVKAQSASHDSTQWTPGRSTHGVQSRLHWSPPAWCFGGFENPHHITAARLIPMLMGHMLAGGGGWAAPWTIHGQKVLQ